MNKEDNTNLCEICVRQFACKQLNNNKQIIYCCQQCYNKQENFYFKIIEKYITEYDFTMKNYISEIIPDKIYLGSQFPSKDLTSLQNLGITNILIAAIGLKQQFPEHFQYFQLYLEDDFDEDIIQYIQQSNIFIHQSKKVYVHCFQGVSRSSSFVIAYIMKLCKCSYKLAYQLVKKRRQIIQPNSSFQKQLEKYELIIYIEELLTAYIMDAWKQIYTQAKDTLLYISKQNQAQKK